MRRQGLCEINLHSVAIAPGVYNRACLLYGNRSTEYSSIGKLLQQGFCLVHGRGPGGRLDSR